MNFTLLNSLILAGVIQGVLFGAVIFSSKRYRSRRNYFLAALIICFSYNNLQFYLTDTGIISGRQLYEIVYIPLGSLIPVLLYFYVRAFIKPKTDKKLRWLYLPFILFFIVTIVYKSLALLIPDRDSYYPAFLLISKFQSIFSLLFTLVLIGLSWKMVRQFEKQRTETLSNEIEGTQLQWLNLTLGILFILSIFWGFSLYKFLTQEDYRLLFNLLWLSISIVIYWLGHIGIYKYGVIKERKNIREYSEKNRNYSIIEKQKNEHILALEELVIHQRKYLDSQLNLDLVAFNLQISKGHLSRIINSELNTNFSEYINSLRVKEAKLYLKNKEFAKYTLAAIGLEAGFNSKSTFHKVFKKSTGTTPSEYKKRKSENR